MDGEFLFRSAQDSEIVIPGCKPHLIRMDIPSTSCMHESITAPYCCTAAIPIQGHSTVLSLSPAMFPNTCLRMVQWCLSQIQNRCSIDCRSHIRHSAYASHACTGHHAYHVRQCHQCRNAPAVFQHGSCHVRLVRVRQVDKPREWPTCVAAYIGSTLMLNTLKIQHVGWTLHVSSHLVRIPQCVLSSLCHLLRSHQDVAQIL